MSTGMFLKMFLDAMRRKFGTAVDTICQGNDARLSDARTPTAHAHAPGDVTGTAVVTADVRLLLGVFNQAGEPTVAQIPAGQFGFWTDTDDSRCYLCYNHAGTVKTVELA